MPFSQKLGLSIFTLCAALALANEGAKRAFPEKWGGPNIGGGLLQLLFYAGMILGAVLALAGLAERRRNRADR
jgi:hypothetical protein